MLLRELALQIVELVGGADDLEAHEAGGGAAGAGGVPGGGDAGTLSGLEDALRPSGDVGPPEDPALARLLPDAYRDDPEAANEFRRYTEMELRSGKVAAAKTVLATLPEDGGQVSLSADEAEIWLRSLNDMRLALGVRLGVTEEMSEEFPRMDTDDPRYAAYAVYDWLTGMQDSLVRAMS